MIRTTLGIAFFAAALSIAGSANAIPRDCPTGSQWDPSEGSCVVVKRAQKKSPEETYQAALADLDGSESSSKPTRGVALLKSACARGHGKACFTLGYLYRVGRFVSGSADESLASYQRACDLSISQGCIGAAELYSDGLVGKGSSHERALPLLIRACELGSGRGCFALAEKHEKALGTKRDVEKAASRYATAVGLLQAACPGSAKDCEVLGRAHYAGLGTAKNENAALKAWRAGCDGGAGDSCRLVADAFRTGKGAAIDPLAAKKYYDLACTKYDNASACYSAGFMMLGWKPSARDDKALRGYAVRACDLDSRHCALRGQLYATGVAEGKDDRLASKYFLQACESGMAESCYISGHRADQGNGVPKSRGRAVELWQRSCEMAWAKGCRMVGDAHKSGDGADASGALALRNYQLACIRDDGLGCVSAGDLIASGAAKSEITPVTFYKLGCAREEGIACRRLGEEEEKVSADKRNVQKAIELFEEGCAFGDVTSCENAGDRLYFGQAATQNKARAARFFALACKNGSEKTCGWVDQALSEGPEGREEDRLASLTSLREACDADVGSACQVIGRVWIHGGRLDRKQVARGVELFRKRCEKDDGASCLELGVLYGAGTGVVKDAKKAASIYHRECERNTRGACNLLGLEQWSRGEYEDALTLFHRACEDGDGAACNVEAFAYYTAKGRSWNTAKGAELYQKACELGYSLACTNVGELYRIGVVLKKDAKKSFDAYQKGCTPLDATGCTWVGRAYHLGEVVEMDRDRAEREYLRTCTDEPFASADSCLYLAELYEQGSRAAPSRIAALRQQAFQLAEKNLEESGYYHHLIGVLHKQGIGTMADPTKAVEHWDRGCEAYDPQSCLAGGSVLLRGGDGVEPDRKRAVFMLERACAAAVGGACILAEEAKRSDRPSEMTTSPAVVGGRKGCGGCRADGQDSRTVWLGLACLLCLASWRRRSVAPGRRTFED